MSSLDMLATWPLLASTTTLYSAASALKAYMPGLSQRKGAKTEGGVMKRVGFVLMLLAGSAVTVQAQDPQNGAQWASNVCAECHATRAGQAPSPNGRAPTFAELANAPGMTSAALTVALTTPHAGMPMFVLTSEQRQDIIAYILSLKTSR